MGSTSAAESVEFKNTGTANLNITAIQGPPTTTGFTYTTTCPVGSLAPNATCSIAVTFKPASTSTTTQITIVDNVAPGQQSIALSGAGFGPGISISPPSLNFSQIGTTAPPKQTVTVTNTGSDTLTITNLQNTPASDGFGYTTTCIDASISPAGTCAIIVSFNPTQTG